MSCLCTKLYPYELIFHTHIQNNNSNTFMTILRKLRGKICELTKINQKSTIPNSTLSIWFFHKTDHVTYMRMKYGNMDIVSCPNVEFRWPKSPISADLVQNPGLQKKFVWNCIFQPINYPWKHINPFKAKHRKLCLWETRSS